MDAVVHDYGDLCQAITDLAFERRQPLTVDEFRTLNRCLDNAIGDAVSEFGAQRDARVARARTAEDNERLGVLVHELRNVFQTATLAFQALRPVRFQSAVPPAAWSRTPRPDPGRAGQHPSERLRVHASSDRGRVDRARRGQEIFIDVSDHCRGLPHGVTEAMFRPFTQSGEDRSGLGLGLSIARRGVEADGGRLTARDVPGAGCVFSIELPQRALH